MRRIAIDTNIYTSFKVNDQRVVEAFRDCDFIAMGVTVIAELFYGFSLDSGVRSCNSTCSGLG
jgi:predicted nucleic acid-binding protein